MSKNRAQVAFGSPFTTVEALSQQIAQLQAAVAALSGAKVKVSTASPKGKKASPKGKKKVVTMIEDMTPEEWAIRAKAYKAAKKRGGTYQDWNEAGAEAVWSHREALKQQDRLYRKVVGC